MRVLLDECVPVQLRRLVKGPAIVTTVRACNWLGVRNGDLLRRLVASRFDVFVTTDANLSYQQNLIESGVATVVMRAKDTSVEVLEPLIPDVNAALARIRPGEVIEVGPLANPPEGADT